jgi:hypothetical protein
VDTREIAIRSRRAHDADALSDVSLDAVVDFDREPALGQTAFLVVGYSADDRRISVVQALFHRLRGAHASLRLARQCEPRNERTNNEDALHAKLQVVTWPVAAESWLGKGARGEQVTSCN